MNRFQRIALTVTLSAMFLVGVYPVRMDAEKNYDRFGRRPIWVSDIKKLRLQISFNHLLAEWMVIGVGGGAVFVALGLKRDDD